MTLRQLKPIEKNGSGEYKPKPAGVVLSLGGAIAALGLAGNLMYNYGSTETTLNWIVDRVSHILTVQEKRGQRLTRMEIDIAKIKTLLRERTAEHEKEESTQEVSNAGL